MLPTLSMETIYVCRWQAGGTRGCMHRFLSQTAVDSNFCPSWKAAYPKNDTSASMFSLAKQRKYCLPHNVRFKLNGVNKMPDSYTVNTQ